MDAHTERRLVTCMFVDLVGSTDTTLQVGPERMQRLLNEAFAEMSATIEGHGGTIEKYVGDAIFALFGAPVAHADDAERALRAADACVQWSSAPTPSAPRLAVRIGIETGEALVDLGAVDRRERMAVGACVNIAARLQQHGDPGEVLVGPTCRDATAHAARFASAGTLSLKGVGEIDASRFAGFRSDTAAVEVALVGRRAELSLLGDAFERARHGTATLALVVGPPGQGKSRLASEAIRSFSAQHDDRILEARCRPGSETGVNTPLRQLVSSDVADPTPERVAVRMTQLGMTDAAAVAAAVCHSAGLAADDRLLALSRMEQREMIADSWGLYLAALADASTVLVWVDDLHWADPVLLRVIDRVTTDVDARVLIVATARPEIAGSPHLRRRENRIQIDLAPLDEREARELARAAGEGGVVGSIEGAAGNPLFIIELARARSDAGGMPLTIQAAIAARLDELPTSERELLQRASVVGETFSVRDAALLTEREAGDVAGTLGHLTHRGFVAAVGGVYRFHHALVRDVAYGRLPVAERMALHAEYAMAGVGGGDSEASAHHWWEALKPPDAEWVWEGATNLQRMRSAAFEAHIAAGRRLEERNVYETAGEVYTRAVDLADELRNLALAEASLGRAFHLQGRGDESWEHRQRALTALGQLGSPPPAELYADMLEIACWNWGYFQHLPDDAEVKRLLDVGQRTARASGDDESLARLLAEYAAFTDDVSDADEITRMVDSPDAIRYAEAVHRLAETFLRNGKVARAMGLYSRVFDELVPAGAIINEPEGLMWYGLASFTAGDLDRADGLADRLIHLAQRRSAHTRQHGFGLKSLILYARGDWDGVARVSGEVVQIIDANPDTGFCLVGAASVGYGAVADIVAGRSPTDQLDELMVRILPEAPRIRASSVLLPKVMLGDRAALSHGLTAYAPGLPLRDRQRAWDVCDLTPSIAMTVLERWDTIGPSLARLDEFARGGARLAAALADAIREEEASSSGGALPRHADLRELGYAGISELLRFRPS